MIENRNSNDYLHTDVILSKVSDFDIFKYYCSSFKTVGKKFCSELREDNNPTASIVPWNGKLLYKDFGHPEHTFDCFNYVKAMFNCEFYDALLIIDCDFNLGLSAKRGEIQFTMGYLAYKGHKVEYDQKPTIIRKKRRKWTMEDAKFWKQYLISKEILVRFAVEPLSYYWVNEYRFTCNSISYAFRFGNRYKIYAPYKKDNKWSSNTKKTDIQGWKQLPAKGNLVVLTSSFKDVMCLSVIGVPAIALQSEMQMPSKQLIENLKNRFQRIVVFYDNDFDKEDNPGQAMANRICDKYNLPNIFIPSKYRCKDPSDMVKESGDFKVVKQLLL